MPLELGALYRGFGECEVAYNGEMVTVRFNSGLTFKQVLRIQDASVRPLGPDGQPQPPDMRTIMGILLETLLPGGAEVPEDRRGWDLTRDGKPVPVTFDEMLELPMALLNEMLKTVFAEISDPNRPRISRVTSALGASSQPTASPASTGSSVTPNGQASLPGRSLDLATPVASGAAGPSGFE